MTFHHTLYQIFYGTNKFDKTGDIAKCAPYMLTKENAEKWLTPTLTITQEPAIETQPPTVNDAPISLPNPVVAPNLYYPAQKNSFFWCVYIGAYGMAEYMRIERKSANVEIQERQKILDYFRDSKNTGKLKQGNTKVSNVLIQEIMADVMVATRDPNSVFHMLIALSVFHKKTIYFVRKNKYLVFSYTEDSDDLNMENTLLIYAKNEREYGVCEEPKEEHIRDIIENKYKLVSYDKPLRGVSTYKVNDLEEIARKLRVDICNEQGIALKKPELYNKILTQAMW